MTGKIEQLVNEWYGGYIPDMEISPESYAAFASKVFSMIAGASGTTEFSFRVTHSSTAAFDPATLTITLPEYYFSAEKLVKMFGCESPSAYSITLINGSSLHEGLHLRHSRFDIGLMITQLVGKFGLPAKIVATVINLVEDLVIETVNKKNVDWIANKNMILFPPSVVAKEIEKFDGSPTSNLRLAIAMKNAEVRDIVMSVLDPRIAAVLDRIFSLKAYSAIVNSNIRSELLAILVDMFETEQSEEDGDEGDESSEQGDSDESDSDESDSDESDSDESDSDESDSDESDSDESDSDESDSDESGDGEGQPSNRLPDDGEPMDDEANEVASSSDEDNGDAQSIVEKFLKSVAIERRESNDEERIRTALAKTVSTHIANPGKWDGHSMGSHAESSVIHDGSVLVVRGSNGFAIKIKQMMTSVKTNGMAKASGGKLNKVGLHRIATDGKVFNSRTTAERGRGDAVEVTILVDASGSMNNIIANASNMFDVRPSQSVTIFAGAMAVAKKLTIALVNAGIACRTIAHSTTMNGREMMLYIINDSTDLTKRGLIERDFAEGDRLASELAHNFDGYALREVTVGKLGRQDKTGAKQVVIVLSDGTPYTPNYQGREAIVHSASVCKEARKRGIAVYAINLTKEAVEGNLPIYGAKYNLNGTSNFNTVAETLVEGLVRENG